GAAMYRFNRVHAGSIVGAEDSYFDLQPPAIKTARPAVGPILVQAGFVVGAEVSNFDHVALFVVALRPAMEAVLMLHGLARGGEESLLEDAVLGIGPTLQDHLAPVIGDPVALLHELALAIVLRRDPGVPVHLPVHR